MLPIETISACFPSTVEVCKFGLFRRLRLRPPTIAHAVFLEMNGCSLDGDLEAAQGLIAAWILSQPVEKVIRYARGEGSYRSKMVAWILKSKGHVYSIRDAVNKHIRCAFATFIPKKGDGDNKQVLSSGPKGCGWPLELAEGVCGEYGWSFDDALKMSMATAFALVSIAHRRNGGEWGGPDYFEKLEIASLKDGGFLSRV